MLVDSLKARFIQSTINSAHDTEQPTAECQNSDAADSIQVTASCSDAENGPKRVNSTSKDMVCFLFICYFKIITL